MPNYKPKARAKQKRHSQTAGRRASIAQPTTPVVVIDPELTEAERRDFLTSTDNQPTVNPHIAINRARTEIPSGERSWDAKADTSTPGGGPSLTCPGIAALPALLTADSAVECGAAAA